MNILSETVANAMRAGAGSVNKQPDATAPAASADPPSTASDASHIHQNLQYNMPLREAQTSSIIQTIVNAAIAAAAQSNSHDHHSNQQSNNLSAGGGMSGTCTPGMMQPDYRGGDGGGTPGSSNLRVRNVAAAATPSCVVHGHCIVNDANRHSASRHAVELPCGHTFHGACISRWLASSGECPVCWSPQQPQPARAPGALIGGGGGGGGDSLAAATYSANGRMPMRETHASLMDLSTWAIWCAICIMCMAGAIYLSDAF
jgi:hypothetical protein